MNNEKKKRKKKKKSYLIQFIESYLAPFIDVMLKSHSWISCGWGKKVEEWTKQSIYT